MDNWFILFTALLVAIPAAILGSLLVLRNMVMVGDAISHAVLPGIVVAYLITDSRASVPTLIGAAIMGVFTTFFIDALIKKARIQQDAAIGSAFTFLFAVGVLLIAVFAGTNTDLDQECVLYGDLETTFLDQIQWGNYVVGTVSHIKLIPLNIVIISFLIVAFKPIRIWAFNPDFGKIKGLKISVWHVVIMSLVSIHAVFSFESVGAIMVVGMLVLPSSTALLVVKRFHLVILLAILFSIVSCFLGFYLAIQLNVSIAPSIVMAASFIFVGTFCLHKVVPKLVT